MIARHGRKYIILCIISTMRTRQQDQTTNIITGPSRQEIREEIRLIKKQADMLLKLLPMKDKEEPVTAEIAIKMFEVRSNMASHITNFQKQVEDVLPLAVSTALSEGGPQIPWYVQEAARKSFYEELINGKSSRVVDATKQVRLREYIFQDVLQSGIASDNFSIWKFILEYLESHEDLREDAFKRMTYHARTAHGFFVSGFQAVADLLTSKSRPTRSREQEVDLAMTLLGRVQKRDYDYVMDQIIELLGVQLEWTEAHFTLMLSFVLPKELTRDRLAKWAALHGRAFAQPLLGLLKEDRMSQSNLYAVMSVLQHHSWILQGAVNEFVLTRTRAVGVNNIFGELRTAGEYISFCLSDYIVAGLLQMPIWNSMPGFQGILYCILNYPIAELPRTIDHFEKRATFSSTAPWNACELIMAGILSEAVKLSPLVLNVLHQYIQTSIHVDHAFIVSFHVLSSRNMLPDFQLQKYEKSYNTYEDLLDLLILVDDEKINTGRWCPLFAEIIRVRRPKEDDFVFRAVPLAILRKLAGTDRFMAERLWCVQWLWSRENVGISGISVMVSFAHSHIEFLRRARMRG